mmetsp:Transcript_72493/g.186998  ORF Transcript_72493/g.186998 Transcript_72493/m.186998 type:complete len:265 (+) Transcript_72493:836-1630(+)
MSKVVADSGNDKSEPLGRCEELVRHEAPEHLSRGEGHVDGVRPVVVRVLLDVLLGGGVHEGAETVYPDFVLRRVHVFTAVMKHEDREHQPMPGGVVQAQDVEVPVLEGVAAEVGLLQLDVDEVVEIHHLVLVLVGLLPLEKGRVDAIGRVCATVAFDDAAVFVPQLLQLLGIQRRLLQGDLAELLQLVDHPLEQPRLVAKDIGILLIVALVCLQARIVTRPAGPLLLLRHLFVHGVEDVSGHLVHLGEEDLQRDKHDVRHRVGQ